MAAFLAKAAFPAVAFRRMTALLAAFGTPCRGPGVRRVFVGRLLWLSFQADLIKFAGPLQVSRQGYSCGPSETCNEVICV